MTTTGDAGAVVRNPMLALPAVARLRALPPEVRQELMELLRELGDDASDQAQRSWERRKAPMACYWRAVSVYARHIARAVKQ